MKRILMVLLVVVCATASVGAFAMDWNSFSEASFGGVTVSPTFISGTLSYTLSLSATPTIVIGTHVYNISWVQGFYAFSASNTKSFYAAGSNIDCGKKTTWKWDSDPNVVCPSNYDVAGWTAQGENYRLFPNQSLSFSFTDFQIPSATSVILGLHVGYYDESLGENVTAGFKESKPPTTMVPELPTLLFMEAGGAILLAKMSWRKLRRQN